jgi:hypothetical protein
MTARRLPLVIGVLLCVACGPVPAAGAAGPPLPTSESGRVGVVAPGGAERLVTRRAGEDTVVVAVRRRDREPLRSRRIRGRWAVAPVAFDGATTGLSADGRVLVLARPPRAFPPPVTELAVLDARRLLVRRHVSLPGFFTVDAISPDGRWLYLIQYAGLNVLDYRVRALDTRTGRLATRDVVDPREPDEQMGGLPMTRVMSGDGRWAYTLYSGGEETFIHALDTVDRSAACIDLEMLAPTTDVSGVRLDVSPDGRRVRVRDGDSLIAVVDRRTFVVSEVGAATAPQPEDEVATRHPAPAPARDASLPWPVLIPVACLAGFSTLAVAIVRRRARGKVGRGAPTAS